MAVYRRTNRTRYVLAVLVLAALTLVTVDARSNGGGVLNSVRSTVSDGFAPLQRATHDVLQPIGNFLTGALDYGSLKRENQRLRDQLAQEQSTIASAAADQNAADQVLKQENLPFVAGIPTVVAEIIDNGSSNFETSITIDKGTANGIAVGQPVVAAGGLVGSVSEAYSHTATVTLLSDPTFAVGVLLPGGNVGLAQGVGRADPLKVTVVSTTLPTPKLKSGQIVVTSGLDLEKFPANIPVGRVVSAVIPAGESEPEVMIQPLVPLDQLRFLQVVIWSRQ